MTKWLKTLRAQYGLTQLDLAEEVDLSRSMIAMYESKDLPIPLDTLKLILKKYPNGPPLPEKLLVDKNGTSVYYDQANQNEDSASALREIGKVIARGDMVTVTALRVSLLGTWSAKGNNHVSRTVSALLGAASMYIVVKDFPNLLDGTLLVFQPTDYPTEDTYLLFESKADPDVHMIGWIDPNEPERIKCGSGSESFSDWTLTGWANAIAWGPGETLGDVRIAAKGIGPRTRI